MLTSFSTRKSLGIPRKFFSTLHTGYFHVVCNAKPRRLSICSCVLKPEAVGCVFKTDTCNLDFFFKGIIKISSKKLCKQKLRTAYWKNHFFRPVKFTSYFFFTKYSKRYIIYIIIKIKFVIFILNWFCNSKLSA